MIAEIKGKLKETTKIFPNMTYPVTITKLCICVSDKTDTQIHNLVTYVFNRKLQQYPICSGSKGV